MKPLTALALILLLPVASAAAGDFADFQPANNEDQWELGQSIRVCATETPITDASLTAPDASVTTIPFDSEACASFTLTQAGAYSLSWDVGGPITRTVAFTASGVDWAWWLEFLIVVGSMLGFMFMAWWFLTAFPIIIFPHLLFPAWPFDVRWALPFFLLGIVLQWASNQFRLSRSRKPTKVI